MSLTYALCGRDRMGWGGIHTFSLAALKFSCLWCISWRCSSMRHVLAKVNSACFWAYNRFLRACTHKETFAQRGVKMGCWQKHPLVETCASQPSKGVDTVTTEPYVYSNLEPGTPNYTRQTPKRVNVAHSSLWRYYPRAVKPACTSHTTYGYGSVIRHVFFGGP